jgi:pyridoxal phosphate enzyme (YggS family)
MSDIAGNVRIVRERIAAAAIRSGRKSDDITLVAVTKKFGVSEMLEAIEAGVTDIGENYIQEAADKWSEVGPAARWHFIGHLQRNKAKTAVEVFDVVQSVDSLPLAEELGKRARAAGKVVDALIEVNISEESAKFGVSEEDVLALAAQVAEVDGVRVRGLMGMAPFLDAPEDTRPYFASLKRVWDMLPEENRVWLSMGMTHDFEVAIEEGSNMVRIGTAIFGARLH